MWPCLGSVTHHSQTGSRLESPEINSFSLVNLFLSFVLFSAYLFMTHFPGKVHNVLHHQLLVFLRKPQNGENNKSFTNRKSTGIPRNQLFQFSKINGFCYSFNERRSHSLTFWCSAPIKTRHFVAQWKSEKKKKKGTRLETAVTPRDCDEAAFTCNIKKITSDNNIIYLLLDAWAGGVL